MTDSLVLVVHGGWQGHEPAAQVETMLPYLRTFGHDVVVSDDVESYADPDLMSRAALIVQYVTMSQISDEALALLRSTVAAGAGFAGWHGGIADSFRASSGYQQLVGGLFVDHPAGIIDFEVVVRPEQADHPIVAGIERFRVTSEQYWVLSDPYNTVLAETTTASTDTTAWHTPITSPTIWTRSWGEGRVFVNTVGHQPSDLDVPEVRTTIERGLRWAAKL